MWACCWIFSVFFNSPINTHNLKEKIYFTCFLIFCFWVFSERVGSKTEISDDMLQECACEGNGLEAW